MDEYARAKAAPLVYDHIVENVSNVSALAANSQDR